MSSDPTWLEALQHATTYRQLQAAFDQMSLDLGSQNADPSLSASIDEAIRRIEQERARDQTELAEFNKEYDEFKEQNAGVVGWFKRKMPFTATRKQDVELRDTMRDQEAEVLADNFVIARAQMLKESVLPMELLRTGKPCSHYREQLAVNDSVALLREFGKFLAQASRDVPAAEQFLAQLRTDIDAFASARFAEKDDRELQKSGVDKAREELTKLTETIEDKKKIMSAADDRLRRLVELELTGNDPKFATLQQHLGQLREFVEQCENTKPLLDARCKLLEKIKQQVSALSDLPSKVESLESKLDKANQELRSAQNALQQAEAEYQPIFQRYEAARLAADQANLRVETTRPLVNAYLAEQGLDADSAACTATSSPICAEYESLKAAAATGQSQLQQVASQYESANRQRQQQQSAVDKLSKGSGDLKLELGKLNQNVAALKGEIVALSDQYRMAKISFQSTVQAWLNKRTQLNWQPGFTATQSMPAELLEELFGQQLTTASHSIAIPCNSNASTNLSRASPTSFNKLGRAPKAHINNC